MKIWGLVGMVACTSHATQQNSLIGSIPKIKFSHWSRQCCPYLSHYTVSPNQSFIMNVPHTHIYMSDISLFVEES